MKRSRPKRNYKVVEVAVSDDNFTIMLDGKPAKMGTVTLQLPTHALADAIAREWRGQEKEIDPDHMRLTTLAGAALAQFPSQRGVVIEHILGYGRNELLCYRAAEPLELAARQGAQWGALLEWVHTQHRIRLASDSGISFIEQPVDALLRMQEIVSSLDDFELAALDRAATLAASFVVALALVDRHIGAEEAFAISHLDELFQAEKWGRDAEAESRRAHITAELKTVERFVALLG